MSGSSDNLDLTMKLGSQTKAKADISKDEQKSSAKTDSKNKEISIGAPDIEDEIQLERRDAHVEVETQKLFRQLLIKETR